MSMELISREEVLNLFATHDGKYLYEAIRELPSVELNPKTEWIPTKERLPEESGEYLAYILNPHDKRFQYTMTCYYSAKADSWFPDDETASDNTIAWMPLPEPYRESEG